MNAPQRRVRTHQATSKSRTLNATLVALLRRLQDEGEVRYAPESDRPHAVDLAMEIVDNTIDCLEHERVVVLALGSQVHGEPRAKLEADYRRSEHLSDDERIGANLKLFRGPDGSVYDFPPQAEARALRDGRTVIWKDALHPRNADHAKLAIHEINHLLNSWPTAVFPGDDIERHLNDIVANIVFETRSYVMQATCFDQYAGAVAGTREFQRKVFEQYMLEGGLYGRYMDPYRQVAEIKRRVDAQVNAAWNTWPGNRNNRRT